MYNIKSLNADEFIDHNEILETLAYAEKHSNDFPLIDELLKTDEVIINSPINSTPYILNISLKRKKSSVIVEAISEHDIYVSSVSACASKHEVISDILMHMTNSTDISANSLRISCFSILENFSFAII